MIQTLYPCTLLALHTDVPFCTVATLLAAWLNLPSCNTCMCVHRSAELHTQGEPYFRSSSPCIKMGTLCLIAPCTESCKTHCLIALASLYPLVGWLPWVELFLADYLHLRSKSSVMACQSSECIPTPESKAVLVYVHKYIAPVFSKSHTLFRHAAPKNSNYSAPSCTPPLSTAYVSSSSF